MRIAVCEIAEGAELDPAHGDPMWVIEAEYPPSPGDWFGIDGKSAGEPGPFFVYFRVVDRGMTWRPAEPHEAKGKIEASHVANTSWISVRRVKFDSAGKVLPDA